MIRLYSADGPWERTFLGDVPRVEISQQPPGERGILRSLYKVAEIATEAMNDPLVVAAAIRALKERGNPSTNLGRGKVLLQWVQEDWIWVGDGTNQERMVHPRWMLSGGPDGKPLYVGGDCDDKTILLLGLCGAVMSAVGIEFAVVGHSYQPDRQVGHVLCAMPDEGAWHYMEPSANFAFGVAKKPTREVVVLVPSKEKVCDADLCLTGPNAVPTERQPGGNFMEVRGLSGLGDNTAEEEETETGLARLGAAVDWSKVPVPPVANATADAWGQYLSDTGDLLELLTGRCRDFYNGMTNVLGQMGYPLFGPEKTDWNAQNEQKLVDFLAAADFAVQLCREAASGVRHLIMMSGPDWAIEGFDSDPFRIEVNKTNDGLLLYGYVPKPHTPGQLNLGPVAIGGIILAAIAMKGLTLLIIRAVAGALVNVMDAVVQYKINQAYLDCIQSGKCTPDEAARLARVIGEQQRTVKDGETARINAQNAPLQSALNLAELALVFAAAAAAAWAFVKVYQEVKKGAPRVRKALAARRQQARYTPPARQLTR